MSTQLTAELKKVEERIRELEKQSSVEFVPVLLSRADAYTAMRQSYFWFSFLLALVGFQYFLPAHSFGWDYAFAFSVAAVVYFASSRAWVLRLLISKAYQQHKVEEAAARCFLREEVFATRDRSGVLILVCALEKSVFIMADKGLAAKVDPKEWTSLGQDLARDFGLRGAGETFLKALDALIDRLKADFPPRGDDTNELSDEVRLRDR